MVYESRVGDVVRARRDELAHRGDHLRPRARDPRVRPAGQGAVLEGRRPRPTRRAGHGDRRVHARAGAADSPDSAGERACAPPASTSGRSPNLDALRRRAGRGDRARCRPTRRSSSSGSATSSATGGSCCTPRTASPVHAPWALAVSARIRERLGVDGSAMAGDDGIVVRLPDTDAEPPGAELFLFEPDELDELVTSEVGGSALFAARFRECAARALLLPRYNPGAALAAVAAAPARGQLLEVARKYPSFPIMLETVREVLQDVYDLPALTAIATAIEQRERAHRRGRDRAPSPFARSLLFGYVAAFMYEGDSPLAERRAAALSLDPTLLAELLGRAELRELLDPDGHRRRPSSSCSASTPTASAKDAEGLVDLLRMLGPLSRRRARRARACRRSRSSRRVARRRSRAPTASAELRRAQPRARASRSRAIERWAVVEDAARLRDALGMPVPIGVPTAFLDPVADPIGDLVTRYARTHGPFTRAGRRRPARARHRGRDGCAAPPRRRPPRRRGRVPARGERHRVGRRRGAAPPADAAVLAALRAEVEPVSARRARPVPARLAARRPRGRLRGRRRRCVAASIDQLRGSRCRHRAWESSCCRAACATTRPALLDELTTTRRGPLGRATGRSPGSDGWLSLHLPDPRR